MFYNKTEFWIALFVFVLILLGFYLYSAKKLSFVDGFTSGPAPNNANPVSAGIPEAAPAVTSSPSATPTDLLPKDTNNGWSTNTPSINPKNAVLPSLIDPTSLIGIDTIGQTMKNPNLQERSEPIIPKQNFPWNNSSYEPDNYRRSLELGTTRS